MTAESVPAQLLEVREKIDLVDAQLIEILAQRFALTQQVGLLKASNSLTAVDANREAQKLAKLQALCEERGLNSELITQLFTKIMAQAVKNHELIAAQHQS